MAIKSNWKSASRHLGLRPSQRYKTKVATELCGWARARNIPISTFLKLWFKDLYPSLICSSRYLLFHSFRGVFNTRTQNVLEIRFAPKLCYRHDVDERGEFDFCMHSFCNQLEKIFFYFVWHSITCWNRSFLGLYFERNIGRRWCVARDKIAE